MTDDERNVIKLLSVCLQFPDEELQQGIVTAVEALDPPNQGARAICNDFLPKITGDSVMELQKEYTTTFGIDSSTCLNITYHKFGNGRDRGQALAKLARLYRQAGFHPATHELPDYLPMLLEFVSAGPEQAALRVLCEYRKQFRELAACLHEANSTYAGVMDAIVAVTSAILEETAAK
ncbi:MAG TPA: nitrate reductase molybdenum cofactor assembly chaperone [Planctomycetota bacterium]|nr:nitrate reductase molybdenum cofactor assembly chaperone [Planctomycetota bacterium]